MCSFVSKPLQSALNQLIGHNNNLLQLLQLLQSCKVTTMNKHVEYVQKVISIFHLDSPNSDLFGK